MGYRRLFVFSALVSLPSAIFGQAVISAHSGVVHFSEGSVFIDDQSVGQKFASFPSIKQGSTLRTQDGRAEVLLTPGVLLRVDQNSAIRMQSTSLSDTKVEFLQGSIILDSTQAASPEPVVVLDKDSQIRFPKPGTYRLDSEPALLQVYSGEAEVTRDGKPVTVDSSHLYFLTMGLDTKKVGDGAQDDFYQWSSSRSQTVTADDKLAAQIPDDPAEADSDDDDLSSLDPAPLVGVPGYNPPGGLPSYRPPLGGLGGYTPPLGGLPPGYGSLGADIGIPPLNSTLFDPYIPFAMRSALYPYGLPGYYGVYPLAVIPLYLHSYRYRSNPVYPGWQHRIGSSPYPPLRPPLPPGFTRPPVGATHTPTISRPVFPVRSAPVIPRAAMPARPGVAPVHPPMVMPHGGMRGR